MKPDKKSFIAAAGGFFVGIVNGLLGAGGGTVAVPVLKGVLGDRKKAHINSVALILPLSALSAAVYLNGGVKVGEEMFILVPFGLIGALTGTWLMKHISGKLLGRVFSLMLIYAGVRMLFA